MHVVSGRQIVSFINQNDYLVFSNRYGNIYMHYRFKRETFNVFLLNIFKNKGSMAAILDFTMTARDIQFKAFPVQLLTSNMCVYTLNHVSIIFRSRDVNTFFL